MNNYLMVQGLVRLILVQLELYNNYILGYRARIATFLSDSDYVLVRISINHFSTWPKKYCLDYLFAYLNLKCDSVLYIEMNYIDSSI